MLKDVNGARSRNHFTGRQHAWENIYPDDEASIVLPAKSDSDAMLCLQSYQWLRIIRSLVYQNVNYRLALA